MVAARLSASLEAYLEAIYHVVREKRVARAKDIAARLGVNRSSVTGAFHALAEKGLIHYAPYDVVTLTKAGSRLARDVVRRHDVLYQFFVKVLAVDEAEAEAGACKMEHAVPRRIVERLVKFVEYIEACPRGQARWADGFGYYCEHGKASQTCERCMALYQGSAADPEGRPDAGG